MHATSKLTLFRSADPDAITSGEECGTCHWAPAVGIDKCAPQILAGQDLCDESLRRIGGLIAPFVSFEKSLPPYSGPVVLEKGRDELPQIVVRSDAAIDTALSARGR